MLCGFSVTDNDINNDGIHGGLCVMLVKSTCTVKYGCCGKLWAMSLIHVNCGGVVVGVMGPRAC